MRKRLLLTLCIIFVMAGSSVVLSGAAAMPVPTAQPTTLGGFAQRYVMDDLLSAEIDGVPFSLSNYQPRTGAPIEMIHFVEFGFSFHPEHRQDFGLFVYIFNPGRLDVAPNSASNQIQMSIRNDANGLPIFEKFRLQHLSTSTGDVAGLFSKFQIIFTTTQHNVLFANLNTHARRYDISGIEFIIRPGFGIRDFNVGRIFTVSGFATGFGPMPGAASTLITEVIGRRTLELDVDHTWWRSNTSTQGIGHHHQINSVWFSVPNYILEMFGRLQRIRAEWWEYQTSPVIVTSRRSMYNNFSRIIGESVNARQSLNYGLYMNYQGYRTMNHVIYWTACWVFNNIAPHRMRPTAQAPIFADRLHYLFFVEEIQRFAGGRPIGGVSSEQLLNWILNYDASFVNGNISVNNRQISADLFTNTICQFGLAAGRQRGYNNVEINYGETVDLFFYEDVRLNSSWARFWGAPRYQFINQLGREISPIHTVTPQDLMGTTAQISDRLMVNYGHVQSLRTFYNQANTRDETTFLFRFAHTDYFAEWVRLMEPRWSGWTGLPVGHSEQAYFAQTTMFFDFDIISLTFNGEFGYYIIPVVSDPQDIIPDIVPPTHEPPSSRRGWNLPWWLWLIVLTAVAPIIFAFVMMLIWLYNLVMTPAHFVGGAASNANSKRRRRHRTQRSNNHRGRRSRRRRR